MRLPLGSELAAVLSHTHSDTLGMGKPVYDDGQNTRNPTWDDTKQWSVNQSTSSYG